jgi:hypothetical protein
MRGLLLLTLLLMVSGLRARALFAAGGEAAMAL